MDFYPETSKTSMFLDPVLFFRSSSSTQAVEGVEDGGEDYRGPPEEKSRLSGRNFQGKLEIKSEKWKAERI